MEHSPERQALLEFCSGRGWHPLYAANLMYDTGATLFISHMGPEEGLKQLASLSAAFQKEITEDPEWSIH